MLQTRWIERELPRGPRADAAIDHALERHAAHGGGPAAAPEELLACGCLLSMLERAWLASDRVPLADLGDEEGARVPSSLPPVTDAHVHVFPDAVFRALWRWFEAYAWPIRYKLRAPEVASFLLDRGVARLVLLHYAHKPAMARSLNACVAELCRDDPRLVGFATVLPGEPDAVAILEEAAALGLRGVKLHCHVQAFSPDAPAAMEVFAACERLGLPALVHAGREPNSAMYPVDTHTLCAAARVQAVLEAFPRLKLCVPHFGADEYDAYAAIIERYDHLFVDTTMAIAGLFEAAPSLALLSRRPERVMFGTDFPNLPYAWDRELLRLAGMGLSEPALGAILSSSSDAFLGGAGLSAC